jgi:hypothetical protein
MKEAKEIRRRALLDAIHAQCGKKCPGPREDHGIGDYFSHCEASGVWKLYEKEFGKQEGDES